MKNVFYKYQGAGNDFILFDNRTRQLNPNDYAYFAQLCDRRFGIGADGIMLLQTRNNYDFEMLYYNADGRPSSMCGNGGRCIVAFAQYLGIISDKTSFMASDGAHTAQISKDGTWVSLQMIDVSKIERDGEAFVLNTGSPHYVISHPSIEYLDVATEGRNIRNNATYAKEGINVNFVASSSNGYFVRTYERGVEDETLACGTGATAAAIAMAIAHQQYGKITTPIQVLGGNLSVSFERIADHSFRNIFLEGPAKLVFVGEVNTSL